MRTKNYTAQMELLEIVHNICEKHQLNYTLLFNSALSAKISNDMQDWVVNAEVGLFYKDFCKLLTYLKEELSSEQYYVCDYKTDASLEELYAKLCKRSKVILPEDRKKDERYYDFALLIFPIYYAGNTKSEYKKFAQKYDKQKKILNAKMLVPDTIRMKNCWKQWKRHCAYQKRIKSGKTTADLEHDMLCYEKETRYVFIPQNKPLKGIARLAETYQATDVHQYGEIECRYMNQLKQWTDAYYDKKEQKDIITKPVNQAVLEGPEMMRRVQKISLEILIEFDRICRKYDIKYIIAAGTLLGAVRHKGFIPWDDDIDIFILEEEWQKFLEVAFEEIDSERFFIRTQDTDKDNNLVFGQIKRNGTVYSKGNRSQFQTHRGVFIDILPFYNGSNYWVIHKLQNRICKYYKTKVWAYMGADGEENPLKRFIYKCMQKGSNKKNAEKFYRYAKAVKRKGKYLTYLHIRRNPYHKGLNKRSMFENRVEYEFEGHMFYGPRDYDEFLSYCYSKDYMRYPADVARVNHHMPADIQLGSLGEEGVEG